MRRIDPEVKKANQKAYQKAYYAANREKVKTRSAAWMRANPGAYATRNRAWHRFRRYGMTADDYRDHVVGQAGRCLICLRVPDENLHVDHDHATGAVRGLLCKPCNWMLGHAKDEPQTLRNAIRYLGAA